MPNFPKISLFFNIYKFCTQNYKFQLKKRGCRCTPYNPERFVRYEKTHSHTPRTEYPQHL